MAILLELEPEIESRLMAQAAAQGTSVEVLLKTLVEILVISSPPPSIAVGTYVGALLESLRLLASSSPSASLTLSPQERVERFVNWTKSHSSIKAPLLSDDAINRESIYTREDEIL
jgi:hypothetical protein